MASIIRSTELVSLLVLMTRGLSASCQAVEACELLLLEGVERGRERGRELPALWLPYRPAPYP